MKPGAQAWEDRYSTDHYVYGTEPNDFLAQVVRALPTGRALCLADGEGRNGVYLASLGYDVTSMDQTKAGIEKTMALAEPERRLIRCLLRPLELQFHRAIDNQTPVTTSSVGRSSSLTRSPKSQRFANQLRHFRQSAESSPTSLRSDKKPSLLNGFQAV